MVDDSCRGRIPGFLWCAVYYFLAENQYSWTHTTWHFTPLYYAAYFNFGYGPRFYADGNASGASIGG